MKLQLEYLHGAIAEGEHLPRAAEVAPPGQYLAMPNTFNVIPMKGHDVYNSQFHILALEPVIAADQTLGLDDAQLAKWRDAAHRLQRTCSGGWETPGIGTPNTRPGEPAVGARPADRQHPRAPPCGTAPP